MNRIMTTRFHPLPLLSRTRASPPTPPHPLQEARLCEPSNVGENQREWSISATPPPSPSSSTSVLSSREGLLSDVDVGAISVTTTRGGSQWNSFLQEFSQGRAAGGPRLFIFHRYRSSLSPSWHSYPRLD